MNYSNNLQRRAISRSIDDDKLSHAYIVCGGDSASRKEYIFHIIKEIFCLNREDPPCGVCTNCRKLEHGNMEDLIFVEKDGNSIKVEQIVELSRALLNKPFSQRTVVVIDDADAMNPKSQNKLLKNLEEPAPGTVIILSAGSLFAIYPTIRSRCVILNMGSKYIDPDPELAEKARNIVRYSMGKKPLETIFSEVRECTKTSSDAEKLLEALEIFVRDISVGEYDRSILFDKQNSEILDRIDTSKGYPFVRYIDHIGIAKSELKRKINWKYTMKNLIINMKQEELHG